MQTESAKVTKRSEYNLLPGVRLPLVIIIFTEVFRLLVQVKSAKCRVHLPLIRFVTLAMRTVLHDKLVVSAH